MTLVVVFLFFFSSRRRHTRLQGDWSSDVCSSDLAAVLATAGLAGGFSMGEAVGAFIISAGLIILVGVTGWFERVMNRIPMEIAAALLAGGLSHLRLQALSPPPPPPPPGPGSGEHPA